jgi:D-alanyl-D-alanine carboxypeptidase/Putative peptidoglycan binding domain
MKVLRLGSKGTLTRRWQLFLRGQGFLLLVNGTFDQETDAATRAFQEKHKLTVDGIVGNQSFGKAMLLGFEGVEFLDEAGSGFPKEPKFPSLNSTAERQQIFGKFAFEPAPAADNPERIRILGTWEADNLVSVTVPQLVGIPGFHKEGRVRFHRKAADQLLGVWEEWQEKGLLDRVLNFGGAFNARFIRGSRTVLSNHAFGTAFDINTRENPLGAQPALPGRPGCVFELVPIAHRWGFYWGGHFTRRDGMHFEVAKLLG